MEPSLESKEYLEEMVQRHGSIDRAAASSPFSQGRFRAACKELGVSILRVSVAQGDGPSREEVLEQEVRELRRAAQKERDFEIRDQRMLELLTSKIDALRPRYQPAKPQAKGKMTPHTFALHWSDLHAAEVVDETAMGGLNSYDWDTMLDRHERLLESLASYRDHRPYPIEALQIWACGDMVTGDIHDELRVTNEVILTEATIQLGLDMAAWIEKLVPEYPSIFVPAVFGNHGRRSKKPQFKQAYDNWDWVFYKILELRLASYPSVKVVASKAAQLPFQVYDHNVLLWHGDGVPTNMPGVPWGGIMRRSKELSSTHQELGRTIHHFAVGHYHEPNVTGNRRILMNGSVKGPDEYSLARFGGGAQAAQNLYTFHPRRGLTDVSFLDLQ